MKVEWSADALADLDRFADFLHRQHPSLAPIVARGLIEKTAVLERFPKAGRRIGGRDDYRQVVLRVLNAPYVFQYRIDGTRVVILRVYHGRERR
jgi:plasmid stabilization system protein ParE